MIRFWMLAILLAGATSGAAEARDQQTFIRYHNGGQQMQSPVRYSSPMWISHGQSGYAAPVQYSTAPVQYSNAPVRYSNAPVQHSNAPVQYSNPIAQVSYSQPAGYSVNGQSISPQGGRDSSLQAWAEEEARMMASRGTCGHIRPAPPGCFVGVGCGMTCMGSGRLVAEASYQGKMVRVWQQ